MKSHSADELMVKDGGDKTDEALLFSYSLQRAHEKEFFIRKAIGLALRDYARHNPQAVRNLPWRRKPGFLRSVIGKRINTLLPIFKTR
jgi:hypothetical protein